MRRRLNNTTLSISGCLRAAFFMPAAERMRRGDRVG
nr:MAG TPA: hypothetical protein [Caudoviricetes sp.]